MEEAGPKRQRILIVEDEPFIRLALEEMLSEFGFEVAGSVANISQALDLIAREPIDGAILDVNLGAEKIDTVADQLGERACPFIFTTGYSLEIPERHAGRAVLEKPFGTEELGKALALVFGPPWEDATVFEHETAQPRDA
ncbi:MAG TPA: response regulator [Methylocella sp.]|nr:response regulator [Methylocella sp.]